jgi:hypothetical protein
MIREYLEISRLFNMGLTGVAPVLGALSMWTISETTLFQLFVLFCIGCFSHVYGFVINDLIDIKVDKLSNELFARPLVSGSISRKKAAIFAVACMIASFVVSILFWIVAFIGALQVLFMNMFNGAIKDIDHDEKGLANTLAIRLGAKTRKGVITLPTSFKTVGYAVELTRSFLIFLPFLFLPPFINQVGEIGILLRIATLILLTIITLYSIYKLFCIKNFDRTLIRKWIGIIVIVMYSTTPIMLSSLNLYFILVAFVPPLWFISSNIVLHGTVLEPKTM